MKRVIFDNISELARRMIEECGDSDDCISVNTVCHFELAAALTEELIKQGCQISWLDIHDYKYLGYEYEFVVSLLEDKILVEPAYKYFKDGYKSDGYVTIGGNAVYIHEDCNSKILQHLDSHVVYEFAVEGSDDNCKDDAATCHRSEYETIFKDKHGTPSGFTKTWSTTDESGISSTSTYSFFSDDLETLKAIAKEFCVNM